MAEFIRSKRGGFILTSKGFLYHKTNKSKGRWYWVYSKNQSATSDVFPLVNPVTTPPFWKKEGTIMHLIKMTSLLSIPKCFLPPLFATVSVKWEVLPKLPDRPSLKRAINRKRQAELPRNPQTLGEIRELPEIYRKTLSGKSAQFSVIFFQNALQLFKMYLQNLSSVKLCLFYKWVNSKDN